MEGRFGVGGMSLFPVLAVIVIFSSLFVGVVDGTPGTVFFHQGGIGYRYEIPERGPSLLAAAGSSPVEAIIKSSTPKRKPEVIVLNADSEEEQSSIVDSALSESKVSRRKTKPAVQEEEQNSEEDIESSTTLQLAESDDEENEAFNSAEKQKKKAGKKRQRRLPLCRNLRWPYVTATRSTPCISEEDLRQQEIELSDFSGDFEGPRLLPRPKSPAYGIRPPRPRFLVRPPSAFEANYIESRPYVDFGPPPPPYRPVRHEPPSPGGAWAAKPTYGGWNSPSSSDPPASSPSGYPPPSQNQPQGPPPQDYPQQQQPGQENPQQPQGPPQDHPQQQQPQGPPPPPPQNYPPQQQQPQGPPNQNYPPQQQPQGPPPNQNYPPQQQPQGPPEQGPSQGPPSEAFPPPPQQPPPGDQSNPQQDPQSPPSSINWNRTPTRVEYARAFNPTEDNATSDYVRELERYRKLVAILLRRLNSQNNGNAVIVNPSTPPQSPQILPRPISPLNGQGEQFGSPQNVQSEFDLESQNQGRPLTTLPSIDPNYSSKQQTNPAQNYGPPPQQIGVNFGSPNGPSNFGPSSQPPIVPPPNYGQLPTAQFGPPGQQGVNYGSPNYGPPPPQPGSDSRYGVSPAPPPQNLPFYGPSQSPGIESFGPPPPGRGFSPSSPPPPNYDASPSQGPPPSQPQSVAYPILEPQGQQQQQPQRQQKALSFTNSIPQQQFPQNFQNYDNPPPPPPLPQSVKPQYFTNSYVNSYNQPMNYGPPSPPPDYPYGRYQYPPRSEGGPDGTSASASEQPTEGDGWKPPPQENPENPGSGGSGWGKPPPQENPENPSSGGSGWGKPPPQENPENPSSGGSGWGKPPPQENPENPSSGGSGWGKPPPQENPEGNGGSGWGKPQEQENPENQGSGWGKPPQQENQGSGWSQPQTDNRYGVRVEGGPGGSSAILEPPNGDGWRQPDPQRHGVLPPFDRGIRYQSTLATPLSGPQENDPLAISGTASTPLLLVSSDNNTIINAPISNNNGTGKVSTIAAFLRAQAAKNQQQGINNSTRPADIPMDEILIEDLLKSINLEELEAALNQPEINNQQTTIGANKISTTDVIQDAGKAASNSNGPSKRSDVIMPRRRYAGIRNVSNLKGPSSVELPLLAAPAASLTPPYSVVSITGAGITSSKGRPTVSQ